jgi:hypothetical protein
MDSTPSRSIARPRLVRRWPVALVVLISISAVAFTAVWLKTHVEHASTSLPLRRYARIREASVTQQRMAFRTLNRSTSGTATGSRPTAMSCPESHAQAWSYSVVRSPRQTPEHVGRGFQVPTRTARRSADTHLISASGRRPRSPDTPERLRRPARRPDRREALHASDHAASSGSRPLGSAQSEA